MCFPESPSILALSNPGRPCNTVQPALLKARYAKSRVAGFELEVAVLSGSQRATGGTLEDLVCSEILRVLVRYVQDYMAVPD